MTQVGDVKSCFPHDSFGVTIPMTLPERVKADYETMNLTTGPHPMKLLRESLPNVWRAADLAQAKHGSIVQIAGNVIGLKMDGLDPLSNGFDGIDIEGTGVQGVQVGDATEAREALKGAVRLGGIGPEILG